jgi:hypothetical protein
MTRSWPLHSWRHENSQDHPKPSLPGTIIVTLTGLVRTDFFCLGLNLQCGTMVAVSLDSPTLDLLAERKQTNERQRE